jgi:hypothetical protein
VKALRTSYVHSKNAVETQLMHLMQRQLVDADNGLKRLEGAFDHIQELRMCFAKINALSMRCHALVDQYPVVKEINRARINVQQVMDSLRNITDIPTNVKRVEDMIAADGDLVEIHTVLRSIEKRRIALLRSALTDKPRAAEWVEKINHHFGPVDEVGKTFVRHMWNKLADPIALGSDQPHILVQIAQVIEWEERNDKRLCAIGLDQMYDGGDGSRGI